ARYDVQYFDGTSWQTAPGQLKAPGAPQPNANAHALRPRPAPLLRRVVSRRGRAQLFRIVVTPTGTFGVGIKEAQAFDTTPLGTGFWANKNGKAIIAAGGSTDGVCDVGTYLRGYAPFADLSATATCDQVASYSAAVVKAASCTGASCNTMLKAQMLSTALGLFFREPQMSAA